MPGFFITGTDTGVGKTALTAGLAANLRQKGFDVGIMKAVQTGCRKNGGQYSPLDARFITTVTGIDDDLELVCPYCLEPAAAPYTASKMTGIQIKPTKIKDAYRKLSKRHSLMLVEGAGGIMVPITGRLLMAGLAKMFNLKLLVVARPGLGTINHTLLTVAYARTENIDIAGIIINGYREKGASPAEKMNPALIEELSGIPVIGIIPYDPSLDVDTNKPGRISELVRQSIDWERLSLPKGREKSNAAGRN